MSKNTTQIITCRYREKYFILYIIYITCEAFFIALINGIRVFFDFFFFLCFFTTVFFINRNFFHLQNFSFSFVRFACHPYLPCFAHIHTHTHAAYFAVFFLLSVKSTANWQNTRISSKWKIYLKIEAQCAHTVWFVPQTKLLLKCFFALRIARATE